MKDKEIAELRKRFKAEKNNITHIVGCYVNERREVLSRFDQTMAALPMEEAEMYLGLFRKALSGKAGKNLLDICFSTQQVADSDEHRLLMALRDSELRDDEILQEFLEKVKEVLPSEGNSLILLAYDAYDVPKRKHDRYAPDNADSETVFRYIVCVVCPVKLSKPTLGYRCSDNEFHQRTDDWVVSPPELGFLFPAFDDRAANLYDAMFYTKDAKDGHPDFINAVFCTRVPMPAGEQREAFADLLAESLGADCRLEVVQAVWDQLSQRIQDQKDDPETLSTISCDDISRVLQDCGVSEAQTEEFVHLFDETFGEGAELYPQNLVDEKQMLVCTPTVTVKLPTDRGDLLESREIDGTRYLLIRVEEGVTVDGIAVR